MDGGESRFQGFEEFFNAFFCSDDDLPRLDQPPKAVDLVQKGIEAGILSCSKDALALEAFQLDDSEKDAEGEEFIECPPIGIEAAIHYATELTRYLQALDTTR